MKNYHAVGIAICAAVIITCALSLTDPLHAAENKRPAICPTPTQDNSGYVATDENGDGKPDTVWHVFTTGVCAGWTVGAEDNGTPYTG
ncbi:hypothetical protein ACJ8S7_005108 [Klebsiella pneumoniae]|nr:hypothetical protein [Klebsiella pneumoniae]